mmetsp:Transcript_21278/g.68608  ORF Transcript_21278/g.68608 Transcript_21278/m.68608 type:complete len:357 (+) Transcript_21278:59-1129(+)
MTMSFIKLLLLLVVAADGLVAPPLGRLALPKAATMPMPGEAEISSSVSETPPTTTKDEDFDLAAYFGKKVAAIERALDASLRSESPNTGKIVESMRYSLLAGGKRIRPVMCIAACEMFGGSEAQAMPTAVAIEMIHTMSLIHDDLPAMDDDDLRRGKPTNHVVYGDDVAILAGDALLSTSFEHCAKGSMDAKVPPERIVEVIRRLGEAVGAVGLAGGQVMDLECEAKNDVSLDELTWIHMHKTAKLLAVAVAAGAVLAGATPDDVDRCETYANSAGLAFQVADDILDVTADTATLGKTAGKDLTADKTTYPKLLGLDGAREEAERLYELAKDSLAPYGDKAKPLLAIAKYIVERQS